MQDRKPKLLQMPEDGQAHKPDELEGLPITILDQMKTRLQNGNDSAKWVVRLPSGDTGVYWSAGQNPTLQVAAWFRDNPNTPLPCRIYRRTNNYGTSVWFIEQREEEDETDGSEGIKAGIEEQLTQVGL